MSSLSTKYQLISCVNCASQPEVHQPIIQTRVTHYGHMQGDPLSVVVCPICGLVFLNPQPTPTALDQFYSAEYYAKAPAIKDASTLTMEKRWQRDFLYTWMVKNLPEAVQNWEILDIGAGYGTWLSWFNPTNHLAGIESSRQACEVARTVFDLEMYETDFLNNNLPKGKYDLVTGLAIIEHFNDPLQALVEMNRLLKIGGVLYLQTPDVHGMVLRQGAARYFKIVHTFYFSLETLSSLLLKAGFDIIASRRRPPLIETSGFLYPDNYWSGELDLLAVKRENRELETAKLHPYTSNDKETVLNSLDTALRRDQVYIHYANLYKKPFIRIPFKLIFKIAKLLKLPRSIFKEQAKRL